MSEAEGGRHVHEYAHLHIDTDGAVDDAETAEEMFQALKEALEDEGIDVEMDLEHVETVYDSAEDDN